VRNAIVDDDDGSMPTLSSDVEAEVKELMGLFDLPAFARRGQELEHGLKRLHERCRHRRFEMLEMVRLRLKQWSGAVTGPGEWAGVFVRSIEPLWPQTEAEAPCWAQVPAPRGRTAGIAADLVASIARFNRRWLQFVRAANLEPINFMIEQYNHNYVLEKECVMGSARLAARHFTPVAPVTIESLLKDHPVLEVPELVHGRKN
jgi:hypothetical protein